MKPDEKIQILNHLQSKFSSLYKIAKGSVVQEITPQVAVITSEPKVEVKQDVKEEQ